MGIRAVRIHAASGRAGRQLTVQLAGETASLTATNRGGHSIRTQEHTLVCGSLPQLATPFGSAYRSKLSVCHRLLPIEAVFPAKEPITLEHRSIDLESGVLAHIGKQVDVYC